jgi:hypothetical protein
MVILSSCSEEESVWYLRIKGRSGFEDKTCVELLYGSWIKFNKYHDDHGSNKYWFIRWHGNIIVLPQITLF